MFCTAFDIREETPLAAGQPLVLRQTSRRATTLIKLAILIPLAIAMLLPFAALMVHAATEPAARALVAERPHAAAQIGLALITLSVLFGWPLTRLVATLGAERHIEIDNGVVRVTEQRLFGRSSWQESLTQYRGIVHRVGASLSGNRHELVLSHSNPRRALLLATREHMLDTELDQASRVLGLPVLPASEFYVSPLLHNAPRAGAATKVQAQITC